MEDNNLNKLLEEYKEICNQMNEILLKFKLSSDDLGKLPFKDLQEFSNLNKKLFEINERLIIELIRKNNQS